MNFSRPHDPEQDGDADIFIKLYRERFRFDHSAGLWFERAGHYWTEDMMGEAIRAVDGVTCLLRKGSCSAFLGITYRDESGPGR